MSYIGVQPGVGQYRKLDDISGSFNGATTTFTTSVDGINVTAGSPQQLLVSVGGVIQQPVTDYSTSTNSITFSTAPAGGLDFFAVLMGDAINVGIPSDGSVTSAKLNSDLTIDLASGTAGAPSLTFDSDTGLYSPGANAVGIATNGTAAVTVDSSQRVGIGTTSPARPLDVNGSVRLSSGSVIEFGGTVTNFITGDNSSNYLAFGTNSSERARIDSSGRVGIGTSSPGAALDVRSRDLHLGATSGGAGLITFRRDSGTQSGYFGWDSGSDLVMRWGNDSGSGRLAFNTNGQEKMRLDENGRLLVGTSTARTNVGGSSGVAGYKVQIESSGTDGIACLSLINNYSAGYPGSLAIGKTSGSSVGSNTIVSNGDDIGIISFVGADGTNLLRAAAITAFVDNPPGANDMPGRLVFSTTADGSNSPTERMRISSTGKLTVPGVYNGTTTGGSAVYVEADGDLLRFTSSRKYKTDIETIEDERADAILECRPVWYRSLSQNDIKTEGATKSDWGWYGFIAEEVAEIDPRLVSWATKDAVPQEDGSLKSIERDPVDYEAEGVRYDNFVPLLLNLIKRQKEQIEAMEARLTALETA